MRTGHATNRTKRDWGTRGAGAEMLQLERARQRAREATGRALDGRGSLEDACRVGRNLCVTTVVMG